MSSRTLPTRTPNPPSGTSPPPPPPPPPPLLRLPPPPPAPRARPVRASEASQPRRRARTTQARLDGGTTQARLDGGTGALKSTLRLPAAVEGAPAPLSRGGGSSGPQARQHAAEPRATAPTIPRPPPPPPPSRLYYVLPLTPLASRHDLPPRPPYSVATRSSRPSACAPLAAEPAASRRRPSPPDRTRSRAPRDPAASLRCTIHRRTSRAAATLHTLETRLFFPGPVFSLPSQQSDKA